MSIDIEAANVLAANITRHLSDPIFRRDPWNFFAQVRAESPVIPSDRGVWLLTGYHAAGESCAVMRVSADAMPAANTWWSTTHRNR
jgi:hypothetical protein